MDPPGRSQPPPLDAAATMRQSPPPMRNNGPPHFQQQQQQQQQRPPTTLLEQGRRPSGGVSPPQNNSRTFRQGPSAEIHPYPENHYPLRDMQLPPAPPNPAFYQFNNIRSMNQFNNHHYNDPALNGLDSEDELSQPNRRDTIFSSSSQNSLFQHQDAMSDGESTRKR